MSSSPATVTEIEASPTSESLTDHQRSNGSSSNLYLVTFLATLFLLLFVSCAIVLRSYLLRRRYQRNLDLAFANGIVLAPRAQGSKKKKLGAQPKMYEIWVGDEDEDEDEQNIKNVVRWLSEGKTWSDIMPLTLQTVIVKRRSNLKETSPAATSNGNNRNGTATSTPSASASPNSAPSSRPIPYQTQGILSYPHPPSSATPTAPAETAAVADDNDTDVEEVGIQMGLVVNREDDPIHYNSANSNSANASSNSRWRQNMSRFITPSPPLPLSAPSTRMRDLPAPSSGPAALWYYLMSMTPPDDDLGLMLGGDAGGVNNGNGGGTDNTAATTNDSKSRIRSEMLQISVLVKMPCKKGSILYGCEKGGKGKGKGNMNTYPKADVKRTGLRKLAKTKLDFAETDAIANSRRGKKDRNPLRLRSKASEIYEHEDDPLSDSSNNSSDEDDDEENDDKKGGVGHVIDDDDDEPIPELVLGIMRLNYRHNPLPTRTPRPNRKTKHNRPHQEEQRMDIDIVRIIRGEL